MTCSPQIKSGLKINGWLKKAAPVFVLALCLAVNVIYIAWAHKRVFYAYNDYDGYLNMAWRILNGQIIYTDFYYHSGFVFPYTLAFFLSVFGVNQQAILAELLFSSCVPIALTFLMAKKLPLWLAGTAAFLTAIAFHWDHLFPNYSHDAVLWGLFGVWLLTREGALSGSRSAFYTGFGCGISAALSAMTKENTGVPFAAVFIAMIVFSGRRTDALKGFVCAALAAAAALAVITFPDPFSYFKAAFELQGQVTSSRMERFFDADSYQLTGYWIFAAILLPNLFSGILQRQPRLLMLFAGTLGTAYVSYLTSSLFPSRNHIPFWGPLFVLAALILMKIKTGDYSARKRLLATASLGVLVVISFFKTGSALSYSLETVLSDPPGISRKIDKMPEDLQAKWKADYDYRFKIKEFEGWYCSRYYAAPIDYFTEYIRRFVPQDDKLLIYGDLQLIYALTERNPQYKFPLKFSQTTITEPQAEAIGKQILASPPDWVLVNNAKAWEDNMYRLDGIFGLNGFWKGNYEIVTVSQPWALLRRRN